MINIINNSAQLLIATSNRGKRDEISSLLAPLHLRLIFSDQLENPPNVAETGNTYAENALLKARAYCTRYTLPALADDTGLEVDALDGRPGLHSARYLPDPNASDADRRRQLVSELTSKPRPWTARFVCSVAVVQPDSTCHLTFGQVRGEILPMERGEGGFGYDRLFFLPELGKTMAELSLAEKNEYSHRARAIIAILPYLRQTLH